ncbi:MAG TPA: adenylosuccinate lyase [Acidimicrobiia bacterium]|nr:adenylosuccinate lyase [Acidimicrobiia bacterium]
MIERYSRPEMAALWSERAKLDVWQEVEALALEGWGAAGVAPLGAGAAVRSAPPVEVTAWKERESVTHHDVAAFVDVLAASMQTHGEWLHYGLTSSDVLDTSLGATLRRAGRLLEEGLNDLFEVVRRRAGEHRDTVMIGRTHGIWAEPTTFGVKLAGWAFALDRHRARLARAIDAVSVGTISGAVGTYAHVPPSVEAHVCGRLGLVPESAPTQVVARDRHAEFLTVLALIGAELERFAVEIRHLQRSEVAEAFEAFAAGQKGSSAMPHKRNPIRSENVTGLARLLRGWAVAGMEDVALWHERDISHSSVERVALPDACLALDFALHRMTRLIDGLVVDAARMRANLDATRGLVYSQAVLLALVEAGLERDAAYRIVQRHAAAAWDEGVDFQASLRNDPEVPIDDERLTACFDPIAQVAGAAVVFDRLSELEI